MARYDGLGLHLGSIPQLSDAETRVISIENPGQSRGWETPRSITIAGNATVILAKIDGSGAIQHVRLRAQPSAWRKLVFRCYWDGEEAPSIEAPLGDFFCNGWGIPCQVTSMPVLANPTGCFDCFWEMPFRRSARITITNLSPDQVRDLFYQVIYTMTEVTEDRAYLHAQWRRSNPLPYGKTHTLLDGVRGQGHYVGTYLAWGADSTSWWDEGALKFYLDGDGDWPTVCETGTEDYFGGVWHVEKGDSGEYGVYSMPYLGLPQLIKADGLRDGRQRFGMYRWHVPDPIRFKHDLRVTIQALCRQSALEGKRRGLSVPADIASTVFWYQAEPHAPFPLLPRPSELEV